MAELKDANTNPWYVLMTLYGEQTGDVIDTALALENRKLWNSWVCQNFSPAKKESYAKQIGISPAELSWGDEKSAEVDALFVEQFKARNSLVAEVPSIPRPEKRIDFRRFIFGNLLVLQNAIVQNITLNQSEFRSGVYFSGAFFSGRLYSRKAVFGKNVSFRHAVFRKTAQFQEVEFCRNTNFDGATFYRDAQFSGAKFNRTVRFEHVGFQQIADFKGVDFKGFSHFNGSRFFGKAIEGSSPISFLDCRFQYPTSFRDAAFKRCYPNFIGSVMQETAQFTARVENWPQSTEQKSEYAKESCSIIRNAVAKQGFPEDEHFFFRLEMQFAGGIGNWFDCLPYRIFGIVSDYGHSIVRPIEFLAGIFGFGFGMLLAHFVDSFTIGGALSTAFAVSFSNLLPVFGFGRLYLAETLRDLPAILKFVSGLQTVLALPLLFFLGLGLRTRFRMR